jgi:hypothetical protein
MLYLNDPELSVHYGLPSQFTYNQPFNGNSLYDRACMLLHQLAFWLNDYQVTQGFEWSARQSIGWGYGVEGLTDVIQWP